jgi:hypothetical protein
MAPRWRRTGKGAEDLIPLCLGCIILNAACKHFSMKTRSVQILSLQARQGVPSSLNRGVVLCGGALGGMMVPLDCRVGALRLPQGGRPPCQRFTVRVVASLPAPSDTE